MRKTLAYFFVLSLVLGCSNSSQKTETTMNKESVSETPNKEDEPSKTEVEAVCVWDEISVRSEPSRKSDWLTSINKGEKVTFLGEEAMDTSDKNRKYLKIRLTDGKEGWSLADFIIPEATGATFIAESTIYKRPDLLTKSDNSFSPMDIVAIKSIQDDWVEVVGKRADGTYLTTGWVKNASLSEKDIDIAVAKFASSALKLNNPQEVLSGLREILENSDLSGNSFEQLLQDRIDELSPAEEVEINEVTKEIEDVVKDTTEVVE